MPELAEVEFFRKRWDHAARGERVVRVLTHDKKKLLRALDLPAFRRALEGATLESSEARAKQMLFRFSGHAWLGIHLGMSGELSVRAPDHAPGKHDHLVLVTRKHALVFNDPRMFGHVDFHVGRQPPAWWSKIAPAILSDAFTAAAVADFLRRRRRAPIKAVLLMQERFPGVGNWMADEILWRAAIHPARLAGSLPPREVRALWRKCRRVCRQALDAIAGRGRELPPDLNVNIPRTWLFKHRWRRGGRDPKTGTPLRHATIGGRTTCWSPARQKL
jgi:formamidopyrimidine-DNA glycosylase